MASHSLGFLGQPRGDFSNRILACRGQHLGKGRLLGLTPSSASVAGSAELNVNLGTMNGALEFDNLQQWHGPPGPIGTGTMWNDGDLDYRIAVMGNTFKQTGGGDSGIVTGAFLGAQHKGMGGTLKRDDLTAAFGGER